MDNEVKQFVAVRAFIVKDNKVLILREAESYKNGSNRGQYGFPGGKIKPGESAIEAINREVKEECGLMVKVGKPFYVDEWWPSVAGGKVQIIGLFFECSPETLEVKLGSDFDDYIWMNLSDYKKYQIADPEPKAVETYLNL